MALRCLIVDDEPLACVSLRGALDSLPGLAEVVGEAHRIKAAITAVNDVQPDLIFLDVQMPGGGGFELLHQLESPPAVIFVTAYDQYAVRAFEVNAVDYLLKPVDPERLRDALDRAMKRKAGGEAHALPPLQSQDAVWLELGASGHLRPVADILAVEADGKYAQVVCSDGRRYTVRRTMAEWERSLPAALFTRLDRGLIVNHGAIRSVSFHSHAASLSVGSGGQLFCVGRSGAQRLRLLLR